MINANKVFARSLTTVCAGSLVAGSSALAQTAVPPAPIARVEITGSSIKRTEAEGVSSIQTLSRKEIESSGKTSIADVVRSIAADNNGSISGSFTTGFAGSASGVSLRGLSVSSTLVLINGRRTAPYGFGDDGQRSFVDLNSIPLDAVERVEILKDGASAIYGSDAIAGVVNIILRSNYVGKSIAASVGQSSRNDGRTVSASASIGMGKLETDRYNLFATLDARSQQRIWQNSRDDYIGQADARPWGGRDQRAGATSAGNAGGSSALGTVRPVDAAGAVIPGRNVQNLPGVCAPINLDPTGGVGEDNRGGGCLFDTVAFATVQPATKNLNLFGRGTLLVGDTSRLYMEAGVFRSEAKTQLGPSGLTGAGFDLVGQRVNNTNSGPDQLLMPIGHPDNPFSDARARPRWVDAARPRTTDIQTTVTRLLAGLNTVAAGWDIDTGVLYTESTTDQEQNGYYRQSALKTAMADGSFRIGLGRVNAPGVLALVSPHLYRSGITKGTTFDFKATRSMWSLAGGDAGLAFGAEYRKEEVESQPTPYTESNDIVGLGYSASKGKRNIQALYAELALPVLKSLELQLALRTDRYSDYGNSTTPKLGFKFNPTGAVALRGTYAEGFRAPSAAENGNSAVAAFTTLDRDPVRCPVTGLAADCSAQNVGAITIGNPNVRPETSKSYSLGAVVEPVKNFSISLDWYRIVRSGEITGADPSAVVQNPQSYPDAQIVRGEPTTNFPGLVGQILMVKAPYLNADETRTSGLDLDLRSKVSLGDSGKLNAGLTVTYIHEFTRTNPDGTELEFAGTHGDINLSGNGGTPKTKANLHLGWERGPYQVDGNLRYVAGIDNVNQVGGDCLNVSQAGTPYLNCKVASFTTLDLFGKWRISKVWDVTASISNVFDRMAPLDVQTYGRINYNPSLHQSGAVGRFFTLASRYTF
jgi:iron complex outermembrane receptor protein